MWDNEIGSVQSIALFVYTACTHHESILLVFFSNIDTETGCDRIQRNNQG